MIEGTDLEAGPVGNCAKEEGPCNGPVSTGIAKETNVNTDFGVWAPASPFRLCNALNRCSESIENSFVIFVF